MFRKWGMHKPTWPKLTLAIAATLIGGAIILPLAPQAEAASTRIAKIIRVQGDAQIRKAGGSRPLEVFPGMYLHQGDYLSTGDNASLEVEVVDRRDDVTIGANTELYVSKLEEGNGKHTSFRLWSGSMYVKAGKLTDESDTFDVETPTSVMGVRGTQFYVSADPGVDTSLLVSAGIVEERSKLNWAPTIQVPQQTTNGQLQAGGGHGVRVYPTQQLDMLPGPDNKSVDPVLHIVDVSRFVGQVDPEILKAMIRNKAEADRENLQLIQQLQSGGTQLPEGLGQAKNQQDLDRFAHNLQQFVNAVASLSLSQQKLTHQDIRDIVDQAKKVKNEDVDVNPDGPSQLQLTEQQQELMQQLSELLNQAESLRNKEVQTKQQQNRRLAEQFADAVDSLQQANNDAKKYEQSLTDDEYCRFIGPAACEDFRDAQNRLNRHDNPTGNSQNAGNGGTTTPAPPVSVPGPAGSLTLSADQDAMPGEVDASLTFLRNADESAIEGYRLEWGDAAGGGLGTIAEFPKGTLTVSSVTYSVYGTIPTNASTIWLRTYWNGSESNFTASQKANVIDNATTGVHSSAPYPAMIESVKWLVNQTPGDRAAAAGDQVELSFSHPLDSPSNAVGKLQGIVDGILSDGAGSRVATVSASVYGSGKYDITFNQNTDLSAKPVVVIPKGTVSANSVFNEATLDFTLADSNLVNRAEIAASDPNRIVLILTDEADVADARMSVDGIATITMTDGRVFHVYLTDSNGDFIPITQISPDAYLYIDTDGLSNLPVTVHLSRPSGSSPYGENDGEGVTE